MQFGIWRCYNKDIKTYPAPNGGSDTAGLTQIHINAYKQKAILAFDRMTSPSKFWGLIASGTTIFSIGAIEAFALMSKEKRHSSTSFDTFHIC